MIGRRTLEKSYKHSEHNSLMEIITDMSYEEVPVIFEALPLSQTSLSISLSDEKVGLVREYHFEEFCELNFRSFTSWGLKIPLTEIISYSVTPLKKSLIKLKEVYSKKAKQTFKSNSYPDILSYMKERKSSRPSHHHIMKILRIGMNSSSEMCDEIFCQLVKQTNNNPNK